MDGLKTNVKELKLLLSEYKNQLRRMKVSNVDTYPIIINVTYDEDYNEWRIIR